MCHQRRWPLRGARLARQSTQEQKIRRNVGVGKEMPAAKQVQLLSFVCGVEGADWFQGFLIDRCIINQDLGQSEPFIFALFLTVDVKAYFHVYNDSIQTLIQYQSVIPFPLSPLVFRCRVMYVSFQVLCPVVYESTDCSLFKRLHVSFSLVSCTYTFLFFICLHGNRILLENNHTESCHL